VKLYLAFKVSPEIETKVLNLLARIADVASPLTLTPVDRIHVTSLFLGEVPEEIGVKVLHACRQVRSFDVHFNSISHFNKKVLIVKADRGNMVMAVNKIQCNKFDELQGKDPVRREYNPHLTLAKYEGQVFATSAQVWDAVQRCFHVLHEGSPGLGSCRVTSLGLYCKSECLEEIRLAPHLEGVQ
jgi:2'-5' RNA ligase